MARSGLVFFKITWLVIEISTKLLRLKDFFTIFGFVAPSPSSFSKMVFFALLSFLAGGIGYVSRSLWSIRGLRRFTNPNPKVRKSGAVGEVIKVFVAGARVLAGCCRLGALARFRQGLRLL